MSNYRILLRVSDEYIDALKPLMWLFNKYWGADTAVVIGGHTPPPFPLLPNFTFYSIGAPNLYPVGRWSDATIDFYNAMPDDVFIFMQEDFWLNMPVKRAAVQECVDEARTLPDWLRVDIVAERLWSNEHHWGQTELYKELPSVTLVKSRWDTPYQIALCGSIYNRATFIDCLMRGWSPWDIEILGTNRMRNRWGENAPLVLGTDVKLMNYANGYRQDPEKTKRGIRGKEALMIQTGDLVPADLAEMRELGLL